MDTACRMGPVLKWSGRKRRVPSPWMRRYLRTRVGDVGGVPEHPGRYDHGLRRKSKRTGRETGCWLYIAAEELEAAGYDPKAPPPYYRVWGGQRGGVRVRLYRER